MWFLAALSILGVILNIRKDRRGFMLWMLTNAAWAFVDFRHGLYAQGTLFALYFVLSFWGWIRWQK